MSSLVNPQLPLPTPSDPSPSSILHTFVGWANSIVMQLLTFGQRINLCLPKDGTEAMTGALTTKGIVDTATVTLAADPASNLQAATKQYVDTAKSSAISTAESYTDTKVAGFASPLTNTLAADVLLNNTANFFDGPSVTQGSIGTWFASGHVTISDSVAASFTVKLWDGTTVIASSVVDYAAGSQHVEVELSGYLVSPAGNLRLSVKDASAATGKILANVAGLGKDSTISAFRIG